MIEIGIWLTLEDGRVIRCGEIVCQDPDSRGRIRGAFRYDPDYLADAAAFCLDPANLPLSSQVFETDDPSGLHGVFADALPDAWGRRLLVKKAGLAPRLQRAPYLLLALGGNGLGALSFFAQRFKPPDDIASPEIQLATLVEMAHRIERDEPVDEDAVRALLVAGSSPGGARPKALVQSDDGIQWLAKFPSIQDRLPVVRIEAATMQLAQRAGLQVPETRLVEMGEREALLVRRFDIAQRGGRYHMISLQTLLKAGDWYSLGYGELFEIVRKYGSRPEIDVPSLFRQMVFNALIGNTDDHLKNFSMLHRSEGLRLAPAYDLLPDTENRMEHVLHFDHHFIAPGRKALAAFGRKLGVPSAEHIVEQVADALSDWIETYRSSGVSEAHCRRLAHSINERLAK